MTSTDLGVSETQKGSKCVNNLHAGLNCYILEISSFVWTVRGVFQRSIALESKKRLQILIEDLQLSFQATRSKINVVLSLLLVFSPDQGSGSSPIFPYSHQTFIISLFDLFPYDILSPHPTFFW